MADRSRSPSRASASPSQGHLTSVAPPPHKSRSKSRASATKSKSSTSLQTSAAAERDASRRQRALDRQFDKAKQKLAEEGRETSVPLTEDSPLLNQPGWSPTIPSGSGENQETICTVFGDSSRAMPEPPHQAPSATFTPTAAGVSHREDSNPAISQDIRHLIMQTISQGIDNAFTQRGFPAPSPSGSSDQRPHSDSHPPRLCALRTRSPTPSHHSEDSFLGEEDIAEYNLSEDEESAPDKPAPTGLFRHELFYTLLHKAKVTANMGVALRQSEGASDPSDPNKFLFTEPVSEQRVIPSPKLFLDTIQRQWGHPGAIPTPSGSDKKMYMTDQDLEDLLKVPTVDTPIATLASSSNIIPSDAAEGLRTEDRRAELSTRKTHQAAAWAIRSATAASFFARTSLIWLRQMQERIPQIYLPPLTGRMKRQQTLMGFLAKKPKLEQQPAEVEQKPFPVPQAPPPENRERSKSSTESSAIPEIGRILPDCWTIQQYSYFQEKYDELEETRLHILYKTWLRSGERYSCVQRVEAFQV
ncbi:uncharacterized protein LOC131199441 [Ahaetulla prasina]|uniref:uncharacterized protein LOC131199441 n=1 Tax=Ahaetulla prasina TaxID=499056 RepID=UPI0026471746|nr:uncharacterized protein LOC131199441 [Ahaetulla prasina]